MDFVEAGVAGGDDECGDAPRPAPSDACSADGAEKQNAEYEIFGEVGTLPNDVMYVSDLVVSPLGEQPMKERFDDAASVFSGEEIG